MDGQRFDDLTRALGAGTSRRTLLKGIAGGALATLTSLLDPTSSLATHTGCRHHGKPCRRDRQCCSKKCSRRGKCVCPGGTTKCGGTACVASTETCCTTPADCPGTDIDCRTRTCTDGVCGATFTAADTPTANQTPGDCQTTICDGNGAIVSVNDDTDVPSDGNDCTVSTCDNGDPITTHRPAGDSCDQNGGSVCDGHGACVECLAPDDCPGSDTECQRRTCTGNICGVSNLAAGTPTSNQTTGDCKRQVCNSAGEITSENDDSDVPDDTNGCTIDACSNGAPTHTPKPQGTECGTNGVCNEIGQCVGCLQPSDCPTPGPCEVQTCEDNTCGIALAPSSTVCRAATDPCDIAEHCTGSSPTCPADARHPNGVTCTPVGGGSGTCQNGACQPCPTGQTACGGACVQEGLSCNNTGLPGICSTGTTQCVGDQLQCVPGVEPGSQPEVCNGLDDDCDGVVDNGFDLQTDANNCGECGNVCAFDNATARCVDGTCEMDVCNAGFADCDSDPGNGCETELDGSFETDPSNCGGCGNNCSATNTSMSCVDGDCVIIACDDGFDDCDGDPRNGCETNLDTDVNNCGACSNVCAAGIDCVDGICLAGSCPSGFITCSSDPMTTCECEGTGCCDTSCQTKHDNGIGQFYFDCEPLGTYNLTQANKARQAYIDAGHPGISSDNVDCGFRIAAARLESASSCATWSYSGSTAGHVISQETCVCPTDNSAPWT